MKGRIRKFDKTRKKVLQLNSENFICCKIKEYKKVLSLIYVNPGCNFPTIM